MLCKSNSAIIAVSLFALFDVLAPPSALAITAEVAKKCSALTAKAYPPRVVGNPAGGSKMGCPKTFEIILTNASRTAETRLNRRIKIGPKLLQKTTTASLPSQPSDQITLNAPCGAAENLNLVRH